MKKPRVIMARKCRISANDQTFDLDFWEAVGPEGRFAAVWGAVVDSVHMGHMDEAELRLRRHVARVVRKKRTVSHRRGVRGGAVRKT